MAIDPWGEIIGELDEEAEGVIVVDVNVEKVEEVRNKIPIFADRKPKIYQL
jgi:predicted amidohydrolase